jgi:hypothetical protein
MRFNGELLTGLGLSVAIRHLVGVDRLIIF